MMSLRQLEDEIEAEQSQPETTPSPRHAAVAQSAEVQGLLPEQTASEAQSSEVSDSVNVPSFVADLLTSPEALEILGPCSG